MSAKKPKEKKKEKKNEKPSSEEKKESSAAETGAASEHPDSIYPLVLTSATQELFGCRADEDVTRENPHKLLRKDDIVQDMRSRAAVSDFSPIKQSVMDYPEDEMLLVFDRDLTYGQCFYLVLKPEAKQILLTPPAGTKEEEDEGEEEMEEERKSPEPRPWVSLGSEREIEDESVTDTRDRLLYKVMRLGREFGTPVRFSDLSSVEMKGLYTECSSYQDKNFSVRRLEQSRAVQSVPETKHTSSQTTWKYPKNMWTQYEPLHLNEEEKEEMLQMENLKNFLSSSADRMEGAIQQNSLMDVFVGDVSVPEDDDDVYEGKIDTQMKVYQTFTELRYSKDKVISYINWHPTIRGVIAVSVTEKLSFEERINSSTKLLLNPALIIFWSFSDPIHPQLLLECPDDVQIFSFCPSDTNIIVGGCMNGQVVLWDISGYVDRLHGSHSEARRKMMNTMQYFEDKQQYVTPVVRYCALSGIDGGHRGPVTDVQWLPESFEVSRVGIPVENVNQISVQIVTCSPDGCVMFWDLRSPHVTSSSLTNKRHKTEKKHLEKLHRVPDTFKHLNLIWKPLFKVTLPKLHSVGVYSPMKISLREDLCYSTAAMDRLEVLSFSTLRVPSVKELHHLDNINTQMYVGTEGGELVYTDWKLERDDTGRLHSPKPTFSSCEHDGLMNTVLRSPFFQNVLLTVGGWTFAIWREGVTNGPIFRAPSSSCECTSGFWSLTRPAVFFIGKEDGTLEMWDLLEKTHEPELIQNISTAQISCIRPWIVSSARRHFLAVSDHLGTLHVLEIPWSILHPTPDEEQNMSRYLDREVECLIYFEKKMETRETDRKAMEEEEKNMKTMKNASEDVMTEMDDDEMEELRKEVQENYEEYFTLEKLLIEQLGLQKETPNAINA